MDKLLFTPGPLTTSDMVKQALVRDVGSRDTEFIQVIANIRNELTKLGKCENTHSTILTPGSGTYSIESVISSMVPADGAILILNNGAYGARMVKIAKAHGIQVIDQSCPENEYPSAEALEENLVHFPNITHVALVHCETTTGIINPIQPYSEIAKKHNKAFILDAMSSFGAYEMDLNALNIDFLISSSNKCVEGLPGFAFVIANKTLLQNNANHARTLSLDLVAQWRSLETDGQFRFTPPTNVLLAFWQALQELYIEGGVLARADRYYANYALTLKKMTEMGFEAYLPAEKQGYIITSYRYPKSEKFNFQEFYEKLSEKGFLIYPGKVSSADCFRIGHIGKLEIKQVEALMIAIEQVLIEMEINLKGAAQDD